MKTNNPIEGNFLSIPHYLLSANTERTKIDLQDKALLSLILSLQRQGKTCTASNHYISTHLGISASTLKRMVNKLNKLPFFQSNPDSKKTGKGSYFNKSTKVVFEDILKEYIQSAAGAQCEAPILIDGNPIELIPVQVSADVDGDLNAPQQTIIQTGKQFTRDEAMAFLSGLMEKIETEIFNSYSPNEQVDLNLRRAVLDADISDQDKTMYIEWIPEFISVELHVIREWLDSHHQNNDAA